MRGSNTSYSERQFSGRPYRKRLRLVLAAMICSLLVGLDSWGEPLEDLLRQTRNIARQHEASGEIVIVAVDDHSLSQLSTWPWPRRYHARIIEKLDDLGAQKIVVDFNFPSRADPQDDRALQQALESLGTRATLPAEFTVDTVSGERTNLLPMPALRKEVDLGNVNFPYNYRGQVWNIPYSMEIEGSSYPSFAAKIAGVSGAEGQTFPIDFSTDPRSIPVVSAIDVLRGTIEPEQVAGKSIILAPTSPQLGQNYHIPGCCWMPAAYLHVLGAETLRAGPPVDLGWLLPFCLTLVLIIGIAFLRDSRAGLACAGVFVAWLLIPLGLEHRLIFIDVVPSIIFALIVGIGCGWASIRNFYKARASINIRSGLPNLDAFRADARKRDLPLIVAKIQNYSEIAAALTPEAEEALIKQFASRLSLVLPGSSLHQGDDGVFAWLVHEVAPEAVGEHLDALCEFFRAPVMVMDSTVDLSVVLGLDAGTERSLSNRLATALVAADEAARDGRKWKQYDPARLEDAAWKLSLLSQLDEAIESGAVFVAFQPKLCLRTRRIIGAEALVRWNHPERGMIAPMDFILAAEQRGRIGKLTSFVLERSIEAAARLDEPGCTFNIAVNLSGRLINDADLAASILNLLDEYKLAPGQLTLEITETAALAGAGKDIDTLLRMRERGVQLSIDDYGTGLSTLDYLKRIPATEIKIDKSFIQAIEKSHSDKLMVLSTIQLAHSLGLKVVAEGVEQERTLEDLAGMGCDIAQGFFIGRPMPLENFERLLTTQRKAA